MNSEEGRASAIEEGKKPPYKNLKDDIEKKADDFYHDHEDEFYEIAFFVGVANCIFTVFTIAKFPEYFWITYVPKSFGLILFRFIQWTKRKLQYFLLDLCYWVNFALVAFLLLGVSGVLSSQLLNIFFRLIFAISLGPLAWSIALFHNSLVFHSPDKITSLFIHLEPPLVCWAMRWFPDNAMIPVSDFDAASVRDLLLNPIIFYLVFWNIPYTIWLFAQGVEVSKHGYRTLYSDVLHKMKPIRKLTTSMGKFGPLGYMLVHLVFSAFTISLSFLWWNYFWCHTIFLVIMLGISTWNGSTFYITKMFVKEKPQLQ